MCKKNLLAIKSQDCMALIDSLDYNELADLFLHIVIWSDISDHAWVGKWRETAFTRK